MSAQPRRLSSSSWERAAFVKRHRADVEADFLREHTQRFSDPIREALMQRWGETRDARGERAANLELVDYSDAHKGGLVWHSSEKQLRAWARRRTDEAMFMAQHRSPRDAYDTLVPWAESWGVKVPEPGKDGKPPTVPGIALRLQCSKWWRRQARVILFRRIEHQAIKLGLINATRTPYCSDQLLELKRDQRRRNRELLQLLVAVNELGECYTLEELAALSTSNHELRRAELMTRVKGMETVALSRGDLGLFVTLTAPSRFHAVQSNGRRNPKYEGATPRETQAYLRNVWARTRAALAKHDVKLYGMRVVEPHHDETPHWHFVMFVKPEHEFLLRLELKNQAMADSPDEPGAARHRLTIKCIRDDVDPATGKPYSVCGYVAKYLAKNVDGYQLEITQEVTGQGTLLTSRDPKTAAERIGAWASTWGIRQFQFFGAPPVTWWRELRRLASSSVELIEQARAPADAGDYGAHMTALGGPALRRDEYPIATWREPSNRITTYLEPAAADLRGLKTLQGETVETRFHTWSVLQMPFPVAPRTRVNNCNSASIESAPIAPSPPPVSTSPP